MSLCFYLSPLYVCCAFFCTFPPFPSSFLFPSLPLGLQVCPHPQALLLHLASAGGLQIALVLCLSWLTELYLVTGTPSQATSILLSSSDSMRVPFPEDGIVSEWGLQW